MHRLVIGAEALRDAGDLRALGEDMLAGRAGDVDGKSLREHRREPHRVQHFARHEDIDAHGASRRQDWPLFISLFFLYNSKTEETIRRPQTADKKPFSPEGGNSPFRK